MASDTSTTKPKKAAATETLTFDVSTGLKRVLGSELITDDEVAIFELVKNSFDAGAGKVHIFFGPNNVIVADNGRGMSYKDINDKWLFVAYSSKREAKQGKDFRNIVADRSHYAGSKGIGRFSSDRLGSQIILQTRPKNEDTVHRLDVNWSLFDKNDREHFDDIPVDYQATKSFDLPKELQKFGDKLRAGTVIEVRDLRHKWGRQSLLALKASLAKLINPFGSTTDRFTIEITAPAEADEDKEARAKATKAGNEVLPGSVVNGLVGNPIFSTLKEKTTFISVSIDNGQITTELTDRGEVIYRIREPNPYKHLDGSNFHCEIYYLNTSSKQTFARRAGLPSVQFGSVFLFRNNFRVYPVGEVTDDWFGFDRRKQQGFSRFLGTREVIGRVDVFGSDEDFQEASSRNQGLIDTPAARQLREAVMKHCLQRLEKYVVPVSWVDPDDANTGDLSRLMTDQGRARVTKAVASLVDNDEVELLDYSKRLVSIVNERSNDFETSLGGLRAIAEKTGNKPLIEKLTKAERRYEEMRKSTVEAHKIADRERAVSEAAVERAETAEAAAEIERRRAHFLESAVKLDAKTILNLHHQVTIYAVVVAQQIENFLSATAGQKSIPRETVLEAMEQIAFLNNKVMTITRFASKANFQLDSEMVEGDITAFITEYIENIAKVSGSARMRIVVENTHPGLKMRFNPIDISIVVDNLTSNARRAKATRISFKLEAAEKGALLMTVHDNGQGLSRGVDPKRIFDMGYTTTHGSGLGLYHVRQVLGEIGGTIDLSDNDGRGAGFAIKIGVGKRGK
ncbi:sensor histidine kinase [Bradyrhizobium erythrophlei]|uniref:histidine kinase n=1 Tax=Bradyrhizobium erythrophlei TaxID=1437360 RepID=A0A1H4SF44_9BRAD|nr:sensor histidine kinase [Bradyrhizobium erythrophlei]SEC42769.1 Signal transduction histidine kinase [Bradyrhizobium erythrophlei]